MDRWNSEGIPRRALRHALKNKDTVAAARKINSCLLCRNLGVNEAGLCGVCWASLTEDELKLAVRWVSGEGP